MIEIFWFDAFLISSTKIDLIHVFIPQAKLNHPVVWKNIPDKSHCNLFPQNRFLYIDMLYILFNITP